MKNALLLLFLPLFITHISTAQTTKWGKRGGSASNGSVSGAANDDAVDIATDKHGNVYMLGTMQEFFLDIDGQPTPAYGGPDIIVASWSCDGNYRWSRKIGGSVRDNGRAIRIDTLGNVFVTGYFMQYNMGPVTFEGDTVMPTPDIVNGVPVVQQAYLANYDTLGNLQWLNRISDDNGTAYNTAYNQDVDVDDAGNSYLLTWLQPQTLSGGGFTIDSLGVYVIKFTPQGTMQSVTPLDVHCTQFVEMKMNRAKSNGRYYITGMHSMGDLSIGNTDLGAGAFAKVYAACFDAQGDNLWVATNTNDNTYLYARSALDAQGNMYVSGSAGPGDSFNGIVFSNGGSMPHVAPFVTKLDAGGNTIWQKMALTNAVVFGTGITITSDNKLVTTGSFSGQLTWPGFSGPQPNHAPNTGYDPYIATLNIQTGDLVKIDTIKGFHGANDYVNCIASDTKGNVYITGNISIELYTGDDTLTSAGGDQDLFVAKYGYDCDSIVTVSVRNANEQNKEIVLYPNPMGGTLTVKCSAGAAIAIYNITGQQVYNIQSEGTTTVINTSLLPAGMYMIQVRESNGILSAQKVLKQ